MDSLEGEPDVAGIDNAQVSSIRKILAEAESTSVVTRVYMKNVPGTKNTAAVSGMQSVVKAEGTCTSKGSTLDAYF